MYFKPICCDVCSTEGCGCQRYYSVICSGSVLLSYALCDVGIDRISVFKFVVECHLVLCVHQCSAEFSSLGMLPV